jgi:hypothetical protein
LYTKEKYKHGKRINVHKISGKKKWIVVFSFMLVLDLPGLEYYVMGYTIYTF